VMTGSPNVAEMASSVVVHLVRIIITHTPHLHGIVINSMFLLWSSFIAHPTVWLVAN